MPSPARNLSIRVSIAAIFCLLVLLICNGLVSQEKKPVETDAADKDYAAELPRIPATAAKDAAKTFTVAKGFKMDRPRPCRPILPWAVPTAGRSPSPKHGATATRSISNS